MAPRSRRRARRASRPSGWCRTCTSVPGTVSRRESGEEVAVAIALVDHHPGGYGAGPRRMGRVDLLGGLDVGQRLVHEPLAAGVHDDRAGQVALGQAEPRPARRAGSSAPTRRRPSGRCPRRWRSRPRGRRRCCSRHRSSRSRRWAGAGTSPAAPGCSRSRRIPRTTPRVARMVDRSPSRWTTTPTTRPPSVTSRDQRRAVVEVDAVLEKPLSQPDHDRVAHRVHPLAPQAADDALHQHLDHRDRPAERAQTQADLPEVGLRDDHVGRRLGVGLGQPAELVAEERRVHRHRFDTAPAHPAAGLLGEVVGVLRHPREARRRLLARGSPSPRGRGRGRCRGGPSARCRRRSSRGRAWRRRGRRCRPGRRRAVRSCRDPDPAAGAGRGPAERLAALDDDRAQAVLASSRQRRRPFRPRRRRPRRRRRSSSKL